MPRTASVSLENIETDFSTEIIEVELPGGTRGLQGEIGPKGDTGPSNTLTIGTVERGEDASATITGTSPNQVLNLILPKGDTGEQGEPGIRGPQGEPGIQGPKGENGIWADTTEPPSDYDVWIIPDGTPGTIPTKTSDLTNDSGFITSSNLPTKLSDLTDDLGNSPEHTHSQYLTQHQDISGKEDKSNKVTSISSSSTDNQYPSAKCVYDIVGDIETLLGGI